MVSTPRNEASGDGVFDNLFLDELLDPWQLQGQKVMCDFVSRVSSAETISRPTALGHPGAQCGWKENDWIADVAQELANRTLLPSASSGPQYSEAQLRGLAQRIVEQCHAKTRPMVNGLLPEAPIGRGGKKDDTSCVVAEVVEWTEELQKLWEPEPAAAWPFRFNSSSSVFDGGLFNFNSCCVASHESDDESGDAVKPTFHPNESSDIDWKAAGPMSAQPPSSQPARLHHLSPGQQMFGIHGSQGQLLAPPIGAMGHPMVVNGMPTAPYPMTNPYMKQMYGPPIVPGPPASRFALGNFVGSGQCGNALY